MTREWRRFKSPEAIAAYPSVYPLPSGALMPDDEVDAHLDGLVPALSTLPVDVLIELGLFFKPDRGLSGDILRPTTSHPHARICVAITADRAHRAVLWTPYAGDIARAWFDGVEVPVPAGLGREPVCWEDDDLATFHVVTPDHPGQDWNRVPGDGQFFSLLVYDLRTGRTRLEVPRDDEEWTNPYVRAEGDHVLLFGSDDDVTPARTWER